MITLCIMPSFRGTTIETFKALLTCLAIDSTYLLPMFNII
jgi:hypothetical protein